MARRLFSASAISKRGGRYVRADREKPRPRELIFKWDGMDFVCCGMVSEFVRDSSVLKTTFTDPENADAAKPQHAMTHEEFSRKGGTSRSKAKLKTAQSNLAKARRAKRQQKS
jgi:hypothetical protein